MGCSKHLPTDGTAGRALKKYRIPAEPVSLTGHELLVAEIADQAVPQWTGDQDTPKAALSDQEREELAMIQESLRPVILSSTPPTQWSAELKAQLPVLVARDSITGQRKHAEVPKARQTVQVPARPVKQLWSEELKSEVLHKVAKERAEEIKANKTEVIEWEKGTLEEVVSELDAFLMDTVWG